MIKRFRNSLFLSILLSLTLVSTALAAYTADIVIINSSSTAYTMLGVNVTANVDFMAANDFFNGTEGLDTRVLAGTTQRNHLLVDDRIITALPLPANFSQTLSFTTGSSNLSNFSTIVGHSGNITVIDTANLELADNFTISYSGFLNTDNTTTKNLVYKPGAIRNYTSTGNVTVDINTWHFDFTTDEWTDVGSGISVNLTGQRIDYNALRGAGDNRTFIDLTTISDSNWILDYTWNPTSAPVEDGNVFAFGLWSDNTNFDGYAADAILAYQVSPSLIGIRSIDGGSDTNSTFITIIHGITYYPRLSRSSTTNTTLSIYSDINRTTHISGSPVSLTTAATITSLKYLQGSNFAGAGLVGQEIGWIDDLSLYENRISTSNVSTTEQTIEVGIGTANGNDLHFDGTSTSNIALPVYVPYRGASNFYVSGQFKLDSIQQSGSSTKYIVGFFNNTGDFWYLRLQTGGLLQSVSNNGAGSTLMSTTQDIWASDTWYSFIVSSSSTNSTNRLVTANEIITGTARTSPSGSELYFGHYILAPTEGFIGELGVMTVGLDSLTLQQEQDLLVNNLTDNETDIYYVNEGTGTSITSYGSVGNTATAGAANTWQIENRDYWASISIDSIPTSEIPQNGISIIDNSENWVFLSGNVMPYADNISLSTSGTQQLLFSPNTILDSINSNTANMTDRSSDGIDNWGTINWGANPSGVNLTINNLVPSFEVTAISTDISSDVLPTIEGRINTSDAAKTALLATDPLISGAEAIEEASSGRIPVLLQYWWAYMILAIAAFIAVYSYFPNLIISGIAFCVPIGVGRAIGIYDWWIIPVLVLFLVGLAMTEGRRTI